MKSINPEVTYGMLKKDGKMKFLSEKSKEQAVIQGSVKVGS